MNILSLSFITQVFSSGGVWHKSCFTCGALCDVGCNRVLARDNFLQHCGVPFCKVSLSVYSLQSFSCVYLSVCLDLYVSVYVPVYLRKYMYEFMGICVCAHV